MKRAVRRQSGFVAPPAELLAETVRRVGLAGLCDQERQVSARCSIYRGLKLGHYRDRQRTAGLGLLQVQHAVADMLAAELNHIAAPLAGVESEREGEPCLRSDRVVSLELLDLA